MELRGNFTQSGREILYVDLEDVGEPLRSLRIGHDNQGRNSGWYLDRVEVRPMGSMHATVSSYKSFLALFCHFVKIYLFDIFKDDGYIFNCDRWLVGPGKPEVILQATRGKPETWNTPTDSSAFPSFIDSKPTSSFEISVTTGGLPNAGTSSNVFLTLIDAEGKREERVLTAANSGERVFRSGQVGFCI